MLRGKLRRPRLRTGDGDGAVIAMNPVEMHVPERYDELQRQRGQRQTTSKPPVVNPTHRGE